MSEGSSEATFVFRVGRDQTQRRMQLNAASADVTAAGGVHDFQQSGAASERDFTGPGKELAGEFSTRFPGVEARDDGQLMSRQSFVSLGAKPMSESIHGVSANPF